METVLVDQGGKEALMAAKGFLVLSSALGFLSVALGAFAAHGLKSRLDSYYLEVFQTGVHYQFFHALALGGVAMLMLLKGPLPMFRSAGYCFLFGVCVFSGSLYALALSKVKILGAITPIGGLAFLLGWGLLGLACSRL